MTRLIPTPQVLSIYVDAEIDARTVEEETFTAYAITLALRNANPDLEIAHEDVRVMVHSKMYERIQQGLSYNAELRDWHGQEALTYFHEDAAALPTGTAVLSLPSPIDWDSLLP